MSRHLVLLLCCLAFTPIAKAQDLSDKHEYDKLRSHAIELYRAQNFLAALPEFQKLADQNPKDIPVLESLGFCLLTKAAQLPSPEDRQQTRAQGRKYLEAAKALGDNSELLLALLEKTTADTAAAVYSDNPEVNKLMQQGEDAFAKGRLDEARQLYQQVILLEPRNYFANLYLGDSFFKQQQYGSALVWLQKASEIDPGRDSAFRYWGDALVRMGKQAEAREKFIQAVIAQPYSNNTWRHMQMWAQAQGASLTMPHIQTPAISTPGSDGNKININIDASTLGTHDGRSSWMLYSITRASWHGDLFKKNYPNEKEYRHSLREESAALGVTASAVKGDKKIKQLDPQLALLLRISDAGLIDPYILLNAADQGISKDYVEYRKEHRDLLFKYLDTFVVPPAKTTAGPE